MEFRSIPAAPALAVRGTVSVEAAGAWGADVFDELYSRVERAGLHVGGPGGALFPGWPAWSWAALAAVPLAITFAIHQRRKADRGGVPLLNPRVFAAWPPPG